MRGHGDGGYSDYSRLEITRIIIIIMISTTPIPTSGHTQLGVIVIPCETRCNLWRKHTSGNNVCQFEVLQATAEVDAFLIALESLR